ALYGLKVTTAPDRIVFAGAPATE
ncbi:MAG: hypothetical protein JWO72_1823, partial [Caulobacteraceae bacterium]|nr:hypothetical protein [Caulobacteraceae bacterium]